MAVLRTTVSVEPVQDSRALLLVLIGVRLWMSGIQVCLLARLVLPTFRPLVDFDATGMVQDVGHGSCMCATALTVNAAGGYSER